MAVATPTADREAVRQKRERDQELLVWPDLVFIEFIAAMVFTIAFVVLSTVLNAPLLNRANANITPNPSKAPWYLLNLQELLLHMNPGLAGVTVPTVALIVLMAIPYLDRSNEGQGGWFATPNAIRITIISTLYSSFVIPFCILWDDGAHVRIFRQFPLTFKDWPIVGKPFQDFDGKAKWIGDKNPFDGWPAEGLWKAIWDFAFLKNRVALRDEWRWSIPVPKGLQFGNGVHDGSLDWPQDFAQVPVPLNGTWLWHWDKPGWMPGWMLHVYWYDSDLNIAALTAEFVMPIAAIVTAGAVLLLILRKFGMMNSMRDAFLALFTGFIMVYFSLTIIGAAFRGRGQQLVPFWKVPNLEHDPSIRYQLPDAPQYGLVDPGSGIHA